MCVLWNASIIQILGDVDLHIHTKFVEIGEGDALFFIFVINLNLYVVIMATKLAEC